MSKLVIGAGERRIDGFTHHDVQDLPGIDIVCELYDLPKHVEEGSCEQLHMTHVLEHFPMNETLKVLELLYKLLEPGGELYIEVPNLYWNAEQIVANPRATQNIEYIFGGQLNKWDFHYTGFTPETLKDNLRAVGFEITSLKPNSSIECWSIKNG